MVKGVLSTLLLQSVLLAMIFSPGHSRPWKPTSVQLAEDYATINHQRSETEFVTLRWMAEPAIVPATPFDALMEKYVIISVVHMHVNAGATISFEDVEKLDALDSNGHPLTAVSENALPPAIVRAVAFIKTAMKRSAGQLGDGMKVFTFDAGMVRACTKGKLSVPLAGETYFWETPFPGCS